jgi:hypothetical protein
MKQHFLSLALLLAAMPAIAAVAAPSATAPAVAAAPARYDTPREAMRSYIQARFAKNAAGTREAIAIPAGQKADVEAVVEAIVASDALQKAAVEKFGADGRKLFDPNSAAMLKELLQALEKAKVDIDGNSATITSVPDEGAEAGTPVRLIKTPAGWKLDGATLLAFPGDTPEATARRAALFKKTAAASSKVTADIAAGKYPAAADAYRDYVKLVGQAAKELEAPPETAVAPAMTASSATAPATTRP